MPEVMRGRYTAVHGVQSDDVVLYMLNKALHGQALHPTDPLTQKLRSVSERLEADRMAPRSMAGWVALGIFANDRTWFVHICNRAEKRQDMTYRRVRRWMKMLPLPA